MNPALTVGPPASETTPLLSPGASRISTNPNRNDCHEAPSNEYETSSESSPSVANTTNSLEQVLASQARWYPYVPIVCGLFCLVADLGGSMTDTPEVRLLEMAVCRDYYRVHNPSLIGPPPGGYVEEQFCKLDIIQSDLAYLRAWNGFFMMIPGTFYAVNGWI
jgi:hypothetical protein